MNSCNKCIYSIPGCNEKVVGCEYLNRLTQSGKKFLESFEVRNGEVYEGWFGKGTGMLINGLVVDKNAICYLFEADEYIIKDEMKEKRNKKIEQAIDILRNVIE